VFEGFVEVALLFKPGCSPLGSSRLPGLGQRVAREFSE
jgi:hypothetical protein